MAALERAGILRRRILAFLQKDMQPRMESGFASGSQMYMHSYAEVGFAQSINVIANICFFSLGVILGSFARRCC